ncbi:MAG TPA: methyltransferase domain-containing protein [Solirubrobacterales bacterium]|nr:methyltransferase domain-containing protein [Solirubrobacterales bacterium]
MSSGIPYEHSAHLYDLMYVRRDYTTTAREIEAIAAELLPEAEDLLDVGCGTGRHLEVLSESYRGEGLDINPLMLEQTHARCPRIPLHEDDMRSFDLARSYDVVTCLFSAIGHVETAAAMSRSIERMAAHLRSPGLLIVEPWFTPESFWDGHLAANFQIESETKLAWMYRQYREDLMAVLDIHYLVGGEGQPEYIRERQDLGLFTPQEMKGAFDAVGLEVSYRESDVWNRGLYVGRR